MKLIRSSIPEILIIQPEPQNTVDYCRITETFSLRVLHDNGINTFFQCEGTQTIAYKNTLIGMYYQCGADQQTKLISCMRGRAEIGIIDMREDSTHFGKSNMILISDINQRHVLIPPGFAYGIQTLANDTVIEYKFENKWVKNAEKVFNALDPDIKLKWNKADYIMSGMERYAPSFASAEREIFSAKIRCESREFKRISDDSKSLIK